MRKKTIKHSFLTFLPQGIILVILILSVVLLVNTNSQAQNIPSFSIPFGEQKILPDSSCQSECHFDSVDINGTLKIASGKVLILNVNVFTLSDTGVIDGNGSGYPAGAGPGAGAWASVSSPTSGGGAHGGNGGNGPNSGGKYYDSAFEPTDMGSSAGAGTRDHSAPGGEGGGSLIVRSAGTATLNGIITMNGRNGNRTRFGIGGGAGGSINIHTQELNGSGKLIANGGNGSSAGGGGGAGGRVAVWYASGDHTKLLSDSRVTAGKKGDHPIATGGENGSLGFFKKVTDSGQWDQYSSAGWQWQKSDFGRFSLIRDIVFLNTPAARLEEDLTLRFAGGFTMDNSVLELRGAVGNLAHELSFGGDILLKNNASILCSAIGGKYFFKLITDGDFDEDSSSQIVLTGCGHVGGTGPGAGPGSGKKYNPTGGGGFGGVGGGVGSVGGVSYGSAHQPNQINNVSDEYFGSGGGNNGYGSGGVGGGAFALYVGGDAVINGKIISDGLSGPYSVVGGGAGGSISLQVEKTLNGSGRLQARGGNGASSTGNGFGGGGAGGRIAVYYHGGSIVGYNNSDVKPGSGGGIAQSGEHGTLGFFDLTVTPARFTSYSGWEWLARDKNTAPQDTDADGVPDEGDFNYSNINMENVELARMETNLDLFGNIENFSMLNSKFLLRGNTVGQRKIIINGRMSLANSKILGDGVGIDLSLVGANLLVDENSSISLSSAGCPTGTGAGNTSTGCVVNGIGAGFSASRNFNGGGAGHGGLGGKSDALYGLKYGSSILPSELGSGGGSGEGVAGGTGGGILQMRFAENVDHFGMITSSGGNGVNSFYGGGGASGGSILIHTGTFLFTNTAVLEANGGNGGRNIFGGGGAGGAGGRIMVYANLLNFSPDDDITPGRVAAFAGKGVTLGLDGEDGTGAFMDTSSTPLARTLMVYRRWELVDQDAHSNVEYEFDRVITKNNAFLLSEDKGNAKSIKLMNDQTNIPAARFEKTNILLRRGLTISASAGNGDIEFVESKLSAQGNLISFMVESKASISIDEKSAVILDGNGYAQTMGPGQGVSIPIGSNKLGYASGGGYGGKGANGRYGVVSEISPIPGGSYYGSAMKPDISFFDVYGSGGGNYFANQGGAGGGSIKFVANTITIDGVVSANGRAGNSDYTGSGAGGSVFFEAENVTINAPITAHGGGNTSPNSGGGGAGGRVAIYYKDLQGNPKQVTAVGAISGSNLATKAEYGSVGFLHLNSINQPPDLTVYDSWTFTPMDVSTWKFSSIKFLDSAKIRVDDTVPEKSPIEVQGSYVTQSQSVIELFSDYYLVLDGNANFDGLIIGKRHQVGFSLRNTNPNSAINFVGKIDLIGSGYAVDKGPGQGQSRGGRRVWTGGGGGGYGGLGGGNDHGYGRTYGDASQPYADFGSAGGNLDGQGSGRGGGSISIVTQGKLSLTASSNLKVDGGFGVNGGGGGSGGTIWLSADNLLGSSAFSLRGGDSNIATKRGSGGGGGRLYLCYGSELSATIENLIFLSGGDGLVSGESGTKFISKDCFLRDAKLAGYVKTYFGDVYARGNITGTDTPDTNATFIVAADGTISNFASALGPDGIFAGGADYDAMHFPSAERNYHSNTGIIDVKGIQQNKYGQVVRLSLSSDCDLSNSSIANSSSPVELAYSGSSILDGTIYYLDYSAVRKCQNDEVVFGTGNFLFRNAFGSSSGAGLLVIDGANLKIAGDLYYEASAVNNLNNLASFGVLVLARDGVGGSIKIDPVVTHVVGSYYAEKSFSTGIAGNVFTLEGLIVANSFNFERVLEVETDASSTPSERVIYDGRVWANTPPGMSDFTRALPVFRRATP